MTFTPDYKHAVAWPAHPSNWGYGQPNQPKGFCIHTPEEPADPHGGTPLYFAGANRNASTHYFVNQTGGVYQMVEEKEGAYANGVVGMPYPTWADPNVSLNLQGLSVELEGYASNIHVTLTEPQWKGLVALVADRCTAHGIPLTRQRIFGHYEVSNQRSDPGLYFPWQALIRDVNQYRADEVWLSVVRVRAELVKLANEDKWGQMDAIFEYMGMHGD